MQCEGWRRTGGALSFGPVKWIQCENKATIMLQFKQGDEDITALGACPVYWKECIEHDDITIINASPIT